VILNVHVKGKFYLKLFFFKKPKGNNRKSVEFFKLSGLK